MKFLCALFLLFLAGSASADTIFKDITQKLEVGGERIATVRKGERITVEALVRSPDPRNSEGIILVITQNPPLAALWTRTATDFTGVEKFTIDAPQDGIIYGGILGRTAFTPFVTGHVIVTISAPCPAG